jgi:hypothetical protein
LQIERRPSNFKFRTSNLHLPIETGRWYNIPREERICHLCKETIGDEYHFLLVCKNENTITLRNKYLPNYYRTNWSRKIWLNTLLS